MNDQRGLCLCTWTCNINRRGMTDPNAKRALFGSRVSVGLSYFETKKDPVASPAARHIFPLIYLLKFNTDGIFWHNIVNRSKCQIAKTEELKTRLYSDDETVLTSTEHDSVYENVKTATDQPTVGRHYSGTFCIRTTQAFLRLQGLVCNNQ